MDKKVIQRVAVGGVLINNKSILILRRQADEDIYPNLWELPSGKKELLETTENALVREMKEETGIDIQIISLLSIFDYQVKKETEVRDSVQINFLVKPNHNNFDVKLSEEHQDFAWITQTSLDKYNLTDETRKVIIQAFDKISNK